MLKQRIFTAIAMIIFLILYLFYMPNYLFEITTLFLLAAVLWEWSHLLSVSARSRMLYWITSVLGMISVVLLFKFVDPSTQYLANTIFCGVGFAYLCLAIIWVLTYPRTHKYWKPLSVQIIQSWLIIFPAFIAFYWIKKMTLPVLILVALADSGAYFAGRFFGKTLLLPQVSPKKTWEGLLGGWLASVGIGTLIVLAILLFTEINFAFFLPLFLLLNGIFVFSVLGDLFESMLKRSANVKDSGSILPGHGGILDRLDSYLFALPFCSVFLFVYLLWAYS